MRLALAVPALNEADNVGPALERAGKALGEIPHEIIVVDDDSTDGTAERVRAVAANDPRVRLIVRKQERGLASAVVRGWQASDAPVLGVMDADLQHPPELLPQLWAAIEGGADLAVASRYVPSASVGDWNWGRRVLSRLGIWVTRVALPKARAVSDPASGFFLVRRQAIEGIPLEAQGFKLLVELLERGRITRIAEVPFEFGVRRAGKSKGNLKIVGDQLSLLWTLRRRS